MGAFKNWLRVNELSLGSDGLRDNQPTQTAQITNQVAQDWMGDPKNSKTTSNIVNWSTQHTSMLPKALLDAGAQAVKKAGNVGAQTTAPGVGFQIQSNLLPSLKNGPLKPPAPGKVSMMRRWMRNK